MSPRPYQAGVRRLAATEATRSKIIDAARELLSDHDASAFSIDAIARRANVARMTVYYQFNSKGKLLEALFDDVAARANMRDMRKVFQETDPAKAMNILIVVFCHLWETQGPLLRRLNALAALDTEVSDALTERASWRRDSLTKIVQRLPNRSGSGELIDILHALTSLEVFDTLITHQKGSNKVVKLLQKTAAALIQAF
ncbi:MAG TPA: helix-turn-helix domain-containing protein [Candidatus Eremiobacteraceae bacterium]